MIYKTVLSGTFLSRPNRFIALVETGGQVETWRKTAWIVFRTRQPSGVQSICGSFADARSWAIMPACCL